MASIDKHRLVPLGEWVPALPGLSGLSAIGGLEAGAPSRLWRWGGPPAAVAICYEISNGAVLAHAVAEGAEWILAAANLDPYPRLLQQQYLGALADGKHQADPSLWGAATAESKGKTILFFQWEHVTFGPQKKPLVVSMSVENALYHRSPLSR